MPDQGDKLEILYYYIILAVSFSMMFTFRYAYTTCLNIKDVLVILEVDRKKYKWKPIWYILDVFIGTAFSMPLIAFAIFTNNRPDIVKGMTKEILEEDFDLVNKK